MTWFLVERNLPAMTSTRLAALQCALKQAAHRLSTPSSPVDYVGSIYMPRRGACLCLFRAETSDAVRATNETAQAPFSSVQETIVLLDEGVGT